MASTFFEKHVSGALVQCLRNRSFGDPVPFHYDASHAATDSLFDRRDRLANDSSTHPTLDRDFEDDAFTGIFSPGRTQQAKDSLCPDEALEPRHFQQFGGHPPIQNGESQDAISEEGKRPHLRRSTVYLNSPS
jgi:hypothetical protein